KRYTTFSYGWRVVCNPVAGGEVRQRTPPGARRAEAPVRVTKTAIMFPGQGTQVAGMGRAWRDHPAWAVVEAAEDALGHPLAPLLLGDSAEALARTRESQLAVLLTSPLAWEAS